jgi:hypothetical protein
VQHLAELNHLASVLAFARHSIWRLLGESGPELDCVWYRRNLVQHNAFVVKCASEPPKSLNL